MPVDDLYELKRQLKDLIKELDPEQVWRPIYGPWGEVLAPGLGIDDRLLYSTPGVEFKDKSVIDMGCNFGLYTFQFHRMGASRVMGLDKDTKVIEGCQILKRILGMEQVEFRTFNMETDRLEQVFDMSVMIDVIGKNFIRTGRLPRFLDAMSRAAGKEMFFTIRPIYYLEKARLGDPDALNRIYPGGYVRGGRFHLLEFVRDYYAPRWSMRIPTPEQNWAWHTKYPTHFIKNAV